MEKKSKVANFILGYPIIQNKGEGKYLSYIEAFYDTRPHTVSKEKTHIHQPVQICHNSLKSSQNLSI